MILPPNDQDKPDFVSTLKPEFLTIYEEFDNEHRELIHRMFECSTLDENDCWLFVSTKSPQGYGRISFQGERHDCHRLSATLFLGLDISNRDMLALHKCSCRDCWNPEHLYVGNKSDNAHDSVNQGTNKNQNIDKIYCKRGHLFNSENTYITLRGERVCRICRREHHKKYYRERNDGSR